MTPAGKMDNTERRNSVDNGLYHGVHPMEGNAFIQDTSQTTRRLHKKNSEYI